MRTSSLLHHGPTALWRKTYLASRVASSRGDKSYSDLEGLYSSPSTLCEACAIEHSARTDCLAEDDAHCVHTRCNIATSVSVSHTPHRPECTACTELSEIPAKQRLETATRSVVLA